MVPIAMITHHTRGRTRLRVVDQNRDHGYFEDVVSKLRECEGVDRIEATPFTGSVLIYHTSSLKKVCAFAKEQGLFDVERPDVPEIPKAPCFSEVIYNSTDKLDDKLIRFTNGEIDLNSITIFALLGAAFWQARQGKVLPASTALIGQALGLMSLSCQKKMESMTSATAKTQSIVSAS